MSNTETEEEIQGRQFGRSNRELDRAKNFWGRLAIEKEWKEYYYSLPSQEAKDNAIRGYVDELLK